jgi:hypothetical protein
MMGATIDLDVTSDEELSADGRRGSRVRIRAVSRPLAVFLLYLVVTAAFFRGWLPHLGSQLIGPPEDNMQDFWNTWYVAIAQHPSGFFYTNLIRFPEGTSLIYHSFAYPQVAAIALVVKLFGLGTGALILLQNVSLLLSFSLAGTGAFYLARHFVPRVVGPLAGGFIFAFNPWHVEQVMHHAHASQIEFIPFFVLAYLVTLERRSAILLVATVMLFALCALSSWYYLFYCACFVAFQMVDEAVRDRRMPRGWQLSTPLVTVGGVLVLLGPLLVPMVKAALHGSVTYESGGNTFVADLLAYGAFPPFHVLGPLATPIYERLYRTHTDEWESVVYLGVMSVGLLGWWALRLRPQDRRLAIYVASGMALFCVLATGNWLHVSGHSTLPMPDDVLWHLPFFKNVRTPSRAIIFVYLFMSIGVACAVERLSVGQRIHGKGRQVLVVGAVLALVVLDFLPWRRLPTTPYVCSSGLAVIRDDREQGFGVLDLPSGKPADYRASNFYMFQATCHGRPIAQGNTSRNMVVSLRDRLETVDFEAQRQQLMAAKIKYIVLNHAPMGIARAWDPKDGDETGYSRTYATVYSGRDLTILRVY